MKDESIIELFWSRSEGAIAALTEKYGALVSRIAYNITGSRPDAEECANDTYLKVWNSIPPKRPESLSAYTAKIARNSALSRLRENNAQKRGEYSLALDELCDSVTAEETPETELSASELTRLINEFLTSEKTADRDLFVRRYYLGEPVFEIASETSTAPEKITARLSRQRARLAKFLAKEGYDV